MPQYFGKLPTTNQPWTNIGSVQAVNWSDCAERSAKGDRTIDFDCGNSRLKISILAPNLVRVRLAPTKEFIPRRSWAVTVDDSAWATVPFTVQDTEASVEITTYQIRVCVQKQESCIVCFDKANRPFAQDNLDMGMGWRLGAVAAWKQIAADEHFYGFGERTGFLDKLSEVKTNWTTDALDFDALTDEMYQAIPFFMALRPDVGYGIFFNTTFWSQFDIGAENPGVLKMETRGGELDYYIIYGPEPADILRTYKIQNPKSKNDVTHTEVRQGEWSQPQREVIVELVGVGERRFNDDGKSYKWEF